MIKVKTVKHFMWQEKDSLFGENHYYYESPGEIVSLTEIRRNVTDPFHWEAFSVSTPHDKSSFPDPEKFASYEEADMEIMVRMNGNLENVADQTTEYLIGYRDTILDYWQEGGIVVDLPFLLEVERELTLREEQK